MLTDETDQEQRYDKIFETTGVVENIESTLSRAQRGKDYINRQPRIGLDVTFKNFLKIYDDIQYVPSMERFDPDTDMSKIYELCAANSSLANKLISNVICLDDINQGFADMKSPTARRIIISLQEAE